MKFCYLRVIIKDKLCYNVISKFLGGQKRTINYYGRKIRDGFIEIIMEEGLNMGRNLISEDLEDGRIGKLK